MSKEREGEFCFVVGTQNVGKTDLFRDLMEANERNLVIPASRAEDSYNDVQEIDWRQIWQESTGTLHYQAPAIMKSDNAENIKLKIRFAYALGCELANFTGNRKIFINADTRYIFDVITSEEFGFRNGGLLCDDFKNYIPSNNLPANVPNLVTNRRTKRLDLWFACHDLEDIAPKFKKWNPSIILFYTVSDMSPADRGSRFPAKLYDVLAQQKAEIDAISIEGQNPENPDPAKRCHCRIIHAKEYIKTSA